MVAAIHALGRSVQRTTPEFKGPHLGVKLASTNVRDKSGWKAGTAVESKMSAAVREAGQRVDVSRAGDITFGRDAGGGYVSRLHIRHRESRYAGAV